MVCVPVLLVKLYLDLLNIRFIIHVILLDKGVYKLIGRDEGTLTYMARRSIFRAKYCLTFRRKEESHGQKATFRTAVLAEAFLI